MQIPFLSGGSGGTELNFEVVGGTTIPENPKENTIWVNTPDEVASWIFSATEPEIPEPGMVWFPTKLSAPVVFNVLEKNGIFVYLAQAKQYANDTWNDWPIKIYQNGEWNDLFLDGDFVRNGFLNPNKPLNGKLRSQQDIRITQKDGYVRINAANNISGGVLTEERIDITEYSTVTLYCNIANIGSIGEDRFKGIHLIIANAVNNSSVDSMQTSIIAAKQANGTGLQTLTLNINQYSGYYYPGILMNSETGNFPDIYVYDFYLS